MIKYVLKDVEDGRLYKYKENSQLPSFKMGEYLVGNLPNIFGNFRDKQKAIEFAKENSARVFQIVQIQEYEQAQV